eukprot:TRINITY_DN1711_c0_g3_i7.p2 TRINITY_DN1711_c0_g3~~TRINITY_DN1711_c0_g3_i7.p2  ORF type:complete len:107 (-),score=4.53 TRINITY_DN1711_c0_g3_i7:390-665(-)
MCIRDSPKTPCLKLIAQIIAKVKHNYCVNFLSLALGVCTELPAGISIVIESKELCRFIEPLLDLISNALSISPLFALNVVERVQGGERGIE